MAQALGADELYSYAKELRVPVDLLQKTAELGRLPVVNFAAGGIGRLNSQWGNIQTLTMQIKGLSVKTRS